MGVGVQGGLSGIPLEGPYEDNASAGRAAREAEEPEEGQAEKNAGIEEQGGGRGLLEGLARAEDDFPAGKSWPRNRRRASPPAFPLSRGPWAPRLLALGFPVCRMEMLRLGNA